MADDCEKLHRAETLDSHCSQLGDEREVEVIIDLVGPGDWVLEGRVRN